MKNKSTKTLPMTLAALGVVFGDIGTSPLYAINQIFFGTHHRFANNQDTVLGCVSLIIWAITLVISIKYLMIVLRADNNGEGGIFALYSHLHRYLKEHNKFLLLMLFAAGMLYGDGVITPAISVLSAVEGLKVATPTFEPFIIPIVIGILIFLYSIQSKGTAKIGRIFGVIIFIWFLTIGFLGIRSIIEFPEIFKAFNPLRGIHFLLQIPTHLALIVLGGVTLSITGGEALFADMGHFGKKPIRLGWFLIVFPALLLNYLGQGAYLLSGKEIIQNNLFYSLVPKAFIYPMVILATLATIIASQALISGAFSLTAQAVALGLFPRIHFIHTHKEHSGQIYSPFVNWMLFLGATIMVFSFHNSSNLASIYGLVMNVNMLLTTISIFMISQIIWKWNILKSISILFLFFILDITLLFGNSMKFLIGGYVPFSIGISIFTIMMTWRWGRKATFAAYSGIQTFTISELIRFKKEAATRLDRNVILMVPKPLKSFEDNTPALMQIVISRHGLIPHNLFFVEVIHKKTPYVSEEDRYEITVFDDDEQFGMVASVTIYFGFMEDPNVEKALLSLKSHHLIDLENDPREWTIHVSQENVLPSPKIGKWNHLRLRLFSLLRQISRPGYYYYGLGDNVQLSVEILPVKVS